MPEYLYKCTSCDTEFTITKSMTEIITTYCPKCKTKKVQRIYKPTPFHLKGKGFYKNDNQKPLTNEQ
jgi:putative FmdB family regulatory protein